MKPIKSALLILSLLSLSLVVIAQAQRGAQRPGEQKTAKPAQPQTDLPASNQDIETVKIDTNLVTVPVIASSRTGSYIADLKKEEFKVSEDGVVQQVAFFATVNAPFHVVLMLDTSASTEEKLGQIQQAAIAFVDQLGAADKVKVVSFDNDVRDLNEFTSDKTVLRGVIKQTRSGTGTRLYDAVQLSDASRSDYCFSPMAWTFTATARRSKLPSGTWMSQASSSIPFASTRAPKLNASRASRRLKRMVCNCRPST